jgi:hypothetical protein
MLATNANAFLDMSYVQVDQVAVSIARLVLSTILKRIIANT